MEGIRGFGQGLLAWKYFNGIKRHVETRAAQLRVSLGESRFTGMSGVCSHTHQLAGGGLQGKHQNLREGGQC